MGVLVFDSTLVFQTWPTTVMRGRIYRNCCMNCLHP